MLPHNQIKAVGQAKCMFSPLIKALQKQIETTEDQRKKQDPRPKSTEGIFLKDLENNEIKNEINEI